MNRRILLLGTSPGAGLGVVRSLGSAAFEVHVARIGDRSIETHSRYCSRSLDLGDPKTDLQPVFKRLLELVAREHYDLLIPITDVANELCEAFRDILESHVSLAMPPPDAYTYAHDKARLLDLAERLQIPVPECVTLRGLDDLSRAGARDLGWPCFVKPIYSALATAERIIRFHVTRAANRDELVDLARFHLGQAPIMIQRSVPGVGVGVHLLAWRGRLLSLVQQRRLHEPLHGGGGSYRLTEPLDSLLATYAQRFVEASRWSGVAMLEFKRDLRSNCTSLMEVNGRFWGSLPLTMRAGLDYPVWLAKLHLEGPAALPVPLPEPQLHVRQRHLRHDVVWSVRNAIRRPNHFGALLAWVREFRHVIARNEAWDTERADDPVPALAEWWQDAGRLIAPMRRRFERIAARMNHRVFRLRPALRAFEQVRGRALRVLFVCTGNICRSPFAEHYMRQRLAYAQVRSAGTLQISKRLVPKSVERIARERFGVDLSSHRSSILSHESIEWADVVLAMDHVSLGELCARTTSKTPVLLLGDLCGGQVVRDPFGCDDATIERTFAQMAVLLEELHKRSVLTTAAPAASPQYSQSS